MTTPVPNERRGLTVSQLPPHEGPAVASAHPNHPQATNCPRRKRTGAWRVAAVHRSVAGAATRGNHAAPPMTPRATLRGLLESCRRTPERRKTAADSRRYCRSTVGGSKTTRTRRLVGCSRRSRNAPSFRIGHPAGQHNRDAGESHCPAARPAQQCRDGAVNRALPQGGTASALCSRPKS